MSYRLRRLMWRPLIHLLKRPVYCKMCGRYWPTGRKGKPCLVCLSTWQRIEDDWGRSDFDSLPWRWGRGS